MNEEAHYVLHQIEAAKCSDSRCRCCYQTIDFILT